MQAIKTRYVCPTNVKGGRVKATCDAGSVTLEWDHALNSAENHSAACRALRAKLGWTAALGYGAEWIGGNIGAETFWVAPLSLDRA